MSVVTTSTKTRPARPTKQAKQIVSLKRRDLNKPARSANSTKPTASPQLTVNWRALPVDRTRFFRFCMDNKDLRIELSAQGEITIMSPTGSETGRRNSRLNLRLGTWAERDGTGECFDSSAEFELPDGSFRSPDASWILKERYYALTQAQRETFAPICPDFVIELRSASDRLKPLQTKMNEYIANGARLGWLIDPKTKKVYIYRPGVAVQVLTNPATLDGETVLPGFILHVAELW